MSIHGIFSRLINIHKVGQTAPALIDIYETSVNIREVSLILRTRK